MGLRAPKFILDGSSSSASSSNKLANYTRQCHTRLSNDALNLDEDHDDDGDDNGGRLVTSDQKITINNNGAGGKNYNNNDTNTTNMGQCIILLEPSLKVFQSTCIQNDKARKKKKKKKKRQKSKKKEKMNNGGEMMMMNDVASEKEEGDVDDEVPPQIIRVARFFPQRWVPMKRALLRPPPSLLANDDNNDEAPDAEVSIHYRLRLAKACCIKGLVAAAEMESLQRSFDFDGSNRKRKGAISTNDADNIKKYKTNNEEGDNNNGQHNLMERVRLSLMRLPTDTVIPERSATAFRHVREMILEVMKEGDNDDTKLVKQKGGAEHVVSRVVDWVMTSWTAVVLARGMDCAPPTSSNLALRDNSVSSIEKQFADLLSDRRSISNNPTLILAQAVMTRIDGLLSPENLSSLNGVNLYSLGRLLALFHSSADAEKHIITSIHKCSVVGGITGLEQLAQLLAVYSCCISTTTMSVSADELQNTPSHIKNKNVVKELEGRLHERIAAEEAGGKYDRDDQHMISSRAKSFLEVVLCATAHLVKSNA